MTAGTKDGITLTGHVRTWANTVPGAALTARGAIGGRGNLQVTG